MSYHSFARGRLPDVSRLQHIYQQAMPYEFEARMKKDIPVNWRIAENEEWVENPEGLQHVKPGKVVITRDVGESWPKSVEDFHRTYNVNENGTGTSKLGSWRKFIWDTKGGRNKSVSWGPHTSYINAEGEEKWPVEKTKFHKYYERK